MCKLHETEFGTCIIKFKGFRKVYIVDCTVPVSNEDVKKDGRLDHNLGLK